MRIARVFVWNDERPDGHDEIQSYDIPHHVTHEGVHFEIRTWDIRYPPREDRVRAAI